MKKLLSCITMVATLVSFSFPTTTFAATTQIKGSDVMIIGDSFFALSHEITKSLEKQAKEAGVLSASDSFREYAVCGATLPYIPLQYKNALSSGKVKYVIMDGGGNDCLQCSTPAPYTESSPYIKNATDSVTSLLKQMKADGVVKVFYLFYPNPNGDLGGLKTKLDALRPIMQSTVANAAEKPETYFFDPRPVWDGHLSQYTLSDGIHPTLAGSEATAQGMWTEMQKCNFFGTSTPTIKLGDLNNDTQINALDLALLKAHILGSKVLTRDALKAADMDGNGSINSLDLLKLKKILLGLA